MNGRLAVLLAMITLGVLAATQGTETFRLESGGLRGGLSRHHSDNRFTQIEAYANWGLPRRWSLSTNWSLRPRLELSTGWLTGRGDDGFIGTVGPSLVLSRQRLPFVLVAGVSPTLLSEDTYGDKDFGIPFQFTSHAGLYWQPGSRLELGYRFQHMSNAGLGGHNPGLNVHMFAVGWRF
jgi:hypothetical protein